MFTKTSVFLVAILLAALGAATPALAGPVPLNIVDNHFLLDMPHGDKGTVYFISDKSLILLPSYTNKNYTHACHGRWNYDEKKQTLKIGQTNYCSFLNGTYHVSRHRDSLLLKNPQRELVFQMF